MHVPYSLAFWPRYLFLLLTALVAVCPGCRKKDLSAAEIRAISREFVFAAKNITAGKAEIGMRPETVQPPESFPAPDHIYLTLPVGRRGRVDGSVQRALEQEFDRIATRHGLIRVDQPRAPGLERFDYRVGSEQFAQRTHAIHIVTPLPTHDTAGRAPASAITSARLAIIVDDLGYDRASADALLALPFHLTVAVLPNLPHSSDVAEEAFRRGFQVVLHLPMESANGSTRPETMELRRNMSAEEVSRAVTGMLDSVPHAAGVNNHQGSLATADPQLMAAVMPALRERQLFFVDSRTSAATVAYDAAVRAHVPAASRKVFLDVTQTREAVHRQLLLAAQEARKAGSAIAICHPHPVTLQALREFVPQLEALGVRLVYASEVVR